MTYSYDPTQIGTRGKDQMRFELGDTLVDGGADTCALADEEYSAMLDGIRSGRTAWLMAKLHILEAILFKLSYMVDTKIDVLSYALGVRAELWRKMYEQLRDEILANTGIPTMAPCAARKPPYFHTDMQVNRRTTTLENWPYRKIIT